MVSNVETRQELIEWQQKSKGGKALDKVGWLFADGINIDLKVRRLPREVQITLDGVVYSVKVLYGA